MRSWPPNRPGAGRDGSLARNVKLYCLGFLLRHKIFRRFLGLFTRNYGIYGTWPDYPPSPSHRLPGDDRCGEWPGSVIGEGSNIPTTEANPTSLVGLHLRPLQRFCRTRPPKRQDNSARFNPLRRMVTDGNYSHNLLLRLVPFRTLVSDADASGVHHENNGPKKRLYIERSAMSQRGPLVWLGASVEA